MHNNYVRSIYKNKLTNYKLVSDTLKVHKAIFLTFLCFIKTYIHLKYMYLDVYKAVILHKYSNILGTILIHLL